MSYTESLTQTYTVADIGKVIDCFAADLDMNSQSTGLLTRDLVKQLCGGCQSHGPKGLPAGSQHRAVGFLGRGDPRREIRSVHRRLDSHRPASRQQPLAPHTVRRAKHSGAVQPEVARSDRRAKSGIQADPEHELDYVEHRPVVSCA